MNRFALDDLQKYVGKFPARDAPFVVAAVGSNLEKESAGAIMIWLMAECNRKGWSLIDITEKAVDAYARVGEGPVN